MTDKLSGREWLKALGIGVVNALLLSAIMVPAFLSGLSPFPKPVGLAFAETVVGRNLPLPVGLLFHVAYVTAWTVAFVAVSRDRPTLARALLLALALWLIAVVVFFPVIGWGVFGAAISPKLALAALVPHALFGLFLWALCRAAFPARRHRP